MGYPQIKIRFLDSQVVVAEKPEGLTTVRHPHERAGYGDKARFLPKTLAEILPGLLRQRDPSGKTRVWPVHRLDRDTSGLVVLARDHQSASNLARQFKTHTVARSYLAIVKGKAATRTIESALARDRGDGLRGSHPREGVKAITHVELIEDLGEFSLVRCRLETGRTHQVRIHLAEAGHPVYGDRLYSRKEGGASWQDLAEAKRLALHAAELGFCHPASGKFLHFASEWPRDLATLLARLRKRC